ncbi:SH3 domain-containing kinase-binding protein 1 isoform X3 [Hyalella azteca]|nr:SH3 domain-containing kinase-binding protein 1 isoform X3 [Hyalella azteca]
MNKTSTNPANSAANKRGVRRCRAVFSYAPQHEDELALTEGDELVLLQEVEEGWWKGELRGQVGMFPSNFVEEIISDDRPTKDGVEVCNKNNINANLATDGDCEVKPKPVPSRGHSGRDADLKKELVKKLQAVNGKTPGTPSSGVYPSLTGAGGRVEKTPSLGRADKTKDKINSAIEKEAGLSKPASEHKAQRTPSGSSRPSSLNRKPVTESVPPPLLPPKPVREMARVLYPYNAEHEDELTLKDGDIITLISKDLEDRGWWKGELAGKVGVFPDNFVQIINSDETPKPPRPDKPPTLGTQNSPTASASSSPTPSNDCPAMNGSNEKLLHLNQQRPKGPSRRPPSAVFKENMRNSSESDSNSGLSSLLSPTNSSSAVGFGFPAKEETSTDALISSITEEPNEAGVAQKGVARKPFTSPSLGNGSATPNARTPSVPAKSPSMLGGVGSNQPTVPWLEELNAKQKRKSLMQDLERDVPPSSPTLNQSKPAPLATKRLPQTATASVGSDAQSAKPSEDTIITKPPLAQSQPYKSFSDDLQKQPQQPDLISTAAPARKVSSSFGKPEQSQSADQSQVSEPSSYVKDAALVPGSTAAIARHLQQQSQTSQLSSRSPISVSSNSSIQSNSNLTKPKLAKATISSGTSSTSISSTPSQGPLPLGETSHSAPVEANSSVNSQVTPLDHAEANPAVPNSETITSLDPSVKAPLIQNDPTLILPSSALSSTTPPSSHSVTRNTSTVSAPAVIPASAPIVAHLPSTDSTDSTNAGTIKVEEAVNAVLVVVLPKISELESRLEEQNREHCRQVKLLTEELDEERKKRACLEIELERLKRTMNNYAAHV